MNKSNHKLKLALAAAGGLLASGISFAGAPIAFDQFTVTSGVVTDTSAECSALGWTCVQLDATAAGILTQQVMDPNTGISYLRSIIVESDASGTPGTGVSNLAFSLEQQVYANGINSNNIALKEIISDGVMGMTAEIYEGAFRSDGTLTDPASGGNGAEMTLVQTVAGSGQTFRQEGVNSNVRQRLDQQIGGAGGRFTYAVVAANGQGLFEPTAAGQLGGGDMPALAYTAGDALSVVWLGQNMPGAGTASVREFGFQEYRNFGTANGANVLAGTAVPTGTSTFRSNEGAEAPWTFTSNGPWDWDVNLFGAAPIAP
jgi:hypothetical protein